MIKTIIILTDNLTTEEQIKLLLNIFKFSHMELPIDKSLRIIINDGAKHDIMSFG